MEEKGSSIVDNDGVEDYKSTRGRSGAKDNMRKSFYVLDEDQLTKEKKFDSTSPSSALATLNVSRNDSNRNGKFSVENSPMPAVAENGDNVFSPISPGSPSLNSSMGTAGGSKASRRGTVIGESKLGREERYKKAIEEDPTDVNAISKYGVSKFPFPFPLPFPLKNKMKMKSSIHSHKGSFNTFLIFLLLLLILDRYF